MTYDEPQLIWNDEDGEELEVPSFARLAGTVPIPEWACNTAGGSAAAIVRSTRMTWEEPIWLHPQPAYELQEAGVLELMETGDGNNHIVLDGTTVYIYEAQS